jgi:3-deoxy-manno-octulosonate cytidylyltransferase (CMP-KDO synthetase)
MQVNFYVVIPARYASTRLPGKPLAEIDGVPMIVRVAQQASRSGASEVVVATDDARIVDVVAQAGFAAELTRDDHPSGSDRVMEVASLRGWLSDDIIINVQGDEPLIPPAVIKQVAASLNADASLAAATLCEPISQRDQVFDANSVKVVCRDDGRALYFSRAPVPYARDSFTDGAAALPDTGQWWRHIGIYAYRLWALENFVALPPGRLEQLESLEQLRLLENGMEIRVDEACQPVPGGVDTPEDLRRVRELITQQLAPT